MSIDMTNLLRTRYLSLAVVFMLGVLLGNQVAYADDKSAIDAASLFKAHYAQLKALRHYDVRINQMSLMELADGSPQKSTEREMRIVSNEDAGLYLMVSRVETTDLSSTGQPPAIVFQYGFVKGGEVIVRSFPGPAMRSRVPPWFSQQLDGLVWGPSFALVGVSKFGMVDFPSAEPSAQKMENILTAISPYRKVVGRTDRSISVVSGEEPDPGREIETRVRYVFDASNLVLVQSVGESRFSDRPSEWIARSRQRLEWSEVDGVQVPVKIDHVEYYYKAQLELTKTSTEMNKLTWLAVGDAAALEMPEMESLDRVEFLESFIRGPEQADSAN